VLTHPAKLEAAFVIDASHRYRSASERREWIIFTLRAEGFLSVGDIARALGVSHMTVRRDLQRLQGTGQVRLVYGGVSLSHAALRGTRVGTSADEERAARIGAAAARLVGRADPIAIDTGATGYEIARALPDDFQGIVISNSIPVIRVLASRSRPPRVVGLGGEMLADRCAFADATTVAAIARFRVRTFFLTVDAVDERGVYAQYDLEASVKRALLDIADSIVLTADHQVFSESAPLLVTTVDRIGTLITDRAPPEPMERALRQADVRLLVANDPGSSAAPVSADGTGTGSDDELGGQ
jgi:DeoR/GlpR family transcriptional regulator of sugar metabolism